MEMITTIITTTRLMVVMMVTISVVATTAMTLVARLYILRELSILIRGAMGDLVRKIGADPQKDLNCPSLAELLDLFIHRWFHPM